MENSLINHPELVPLFDEAEFVNATVAQINKDLQGLYFDDLSADLNPDNDVLEGLAMALVPILEDLSKQVPEQLAQFVYRVDLGEKKFLDAITADSTLRQLAMCVIEREALKVYLRQKFS